MATCCTSIKANFWLMFRSRPKGAAMERKDPAWRQQEPPDPPDDDHLEQDYDTDQGEGLEHDWDSPYDCDPNPYHGDYSEE
jgi:hypothetical protein